MKLENDANSGLSISVKKNRKLNEYSHDFSFKLETIK